jgi:alpha-tubulin suppressor-like RCC1 family protein
LPVAVSGLTNVLAIGAGADAVCAIRSGGGALHCWGADYGATPVPVVGTNGATAVSMSRLYFLAPHACALLAGGAVHCWGDNEYGKLGDGTVTGAQAVAVGYDHSCALTSGTVRCWGSSESGQLGNAAVTGAQAISAGGERTCALVSGTVRCWGNGNATPTTASGVTGATAIAVGDSDACAITSGNTVRCASSGWAVVGSLAGATAISLAEQHGCAVIGGRAHCWGDNLSGRLGDGTVTARSAPTLVRMCP